MPERCRPTRRVLVHGAFCIVEECTCGILHVSLGAFTFRVPADVLASVWSSLGEALAVLAFDGRTAAARTARSPERPS